MTTKMTKKRGRPPGSSRKNEGDYRLLEQVADRMVREPSLKPTTAMKALGVAGDSDQRRLRDKWAVKSDDYLDAARSRLNAEREAVALAFRFRIKEDAAAAAMALHQTGEIVMARVQRFTEAHPNGIANAAELVARVTATAERMMKAMETMNLSFTAPSPRVQTFLQQNRRQDD